MRMVGSGPLAPPISIGGGRGEVYKLALDHTGAVIGSTTTPNKLFRVGENGGIEDLQFLGNGKAYSFAVHQGLTYIGVYASDARFYIWDGSIATPLINNIALPTWRPKIAVVRESDVIFGGFYTAAGLCVSATRSGGVDFPTSMSAGPESFAQKDGLIYIGTSLVDQGVDTNVTGDTDCKVYCYDQSFSEIWQTLLPPYRRVSNIWATPTELWCLMTSPTPAVVVLDRGNGHVLKDTAVSLNLAVVGENRNSVADFKGKPLFPASEGLFELHRDGIVLVEVNPDPLSNTAILNPTGSAVKNDRLYVAWETSVWEYTNNIKGAA